MDELVEKVKQWGREKRINNPYRQLNKCLEELGELASEICRDRFSSPEFKDSIGDVLVTIIILADMTENDPEECLRLAYNEIVNRKGITSDGMFIKKLKK